MTLPAFGEGAGVGGGRVIYKDWCVANILGWLVWNAGLDLPAVILCTSVHK